MKGRDKENQCSICLGTLDQPETIIQLQCQHRFHDKCIHQWIEAARRDFAHESCPNCRQPIAFKSNNLPSTQRFLASEPHEAYFQPRRQRFDNNNHLDLNPQQPNRENNHEDPVRDPNDCSSACILFLGIIALVVEGLIIFLYIRQCGELFTSNDLPVFSAGMEAKGYIAVGMIAKGIVAIGMIGQGFFTISMVGIGLLFFCGQVGGGFGFGIYQLGIAWFCKLGQLSIGLWYTERAQIGVSLISPYCNPQRRHVVTCQR